MNRSKQQLSGFIVYDDHFLHTSQIAPAKAFPSTGIPSQLITAFNNCTTIASQGQSGLYLLPVIESSLPAGLWSAPAPKSHFKVYFLGPLLEPTGHRHSEIYMREVYWEVLLGMAAAGEKEKQQWTEGGVEL